MPRKGSGSQCSWWTFTCFLAHAIAQTDLFPNGGLKLSLIWNPPSLLVLFLFLILPLSFSHFLLSSSLNFLLTSCISHFHGSINLSRSNCPLTKGRYFPFTSSLGSDPLLRRYSNKSRILHLPCPLKEPEMRIPDPSCISHQLSRELIWAKD